MNWQPGSMTQRSAPSTSRICDTVFHIKPQKIDACWAISSAAKVTPKTMPKNLARSPVSILSAIQLMRRLHGSRFGRARIEAPQRGQGKVGDVVGPRRGVAQPSGLGTG